MVGLGIPKLVLLVQEQLVQEEVVVLGILLIQQLQGPSNLFLQACKKDTGRIRIPSRLGSQRSSRHRRNILPLPELEQLLEEEEEVVGLDILGLEDSHDVVFALEIRNGLHNSALQVLEQLLG